MPVMLDQNGRLFEHGPYEREADLERDVVANAEQIFGSSSIYVDVKKKLKSRTNVATIPDGYVVDMADPMRPKLFVVENEIASHDLFRHIGTQLLKFVISFPDSRPSIRRFLIEAISAEPKSAEKLEEGAREAGSRNIDAYLDKAIDAGFRALVIIDEAREELHQVLQAINANISVLELREHRASDGTRLLEFDTLYDEFVEESPEVAPARRADPATREHRRKRRAKADTVIVPARPEGFERVFLGEDRWYKIRVGAGIKDQLQYIAAYQVAPISAVTHIAEIEAIRPYEDSGKYEVVFKGPAKEIGPIRIAGKAGIQGPAYVVRDELEKAQSLEEALGD
jgi:hypothetical protein